jgi:hypothetical protein
VYEFGVFPSMKKGILLGILSLMSIVDVIICDDELL